MRRMCRIPLFVLVITMVFWTANTLLAEQTSSHLQASCVKINITPDSDQWFQSWSPRKSEGVHDSLYHRILVLKSGTVSFVLISSDVASISPELYLDLSATLHEAHGISPEAVWWTVTHTHSAPMISQPGLLKIAFPDRYAGPNPEYTREFSTSLEKGIQKALETLQPAELGYGFGFSYANINRRAEDVDGTVSLGMNPDRPVDRQVNLLKIASTDGSLIALIANYAMHGTVVGKENKLISGDAPGIVAQYVESKINAPMLFINAACGDVAPLYSGMPDFRFIDEFNVLLGDRIIDAYESIRHTSGSVFLRTEQQIVRLSRKSDFGWVQELNQYQDQRPDGTAVVKLPVYYLVIDTELVIWASPLELFNTIATNISHTSPFPRTFFFGLTNGWLGYFPTSESFAEGGYETGIVAPYTPQAEDILTRNVSRYLDELSKQIK